MVLNNLKSFEGIYNFFLHKKSGSSSANTVPQWHLRN